MNRRDTVLALAALGAAPRAGAQPAEKVWRLGVLGVAAPGTPLAEKIFEGYKQTLREAGFVEGKNIAFERRGTQGQPERAPALVAELIRSRVDVLMVYGTPSTRAAREATTTLPIVMIDVSDPVATGLVASLARPGGNITGTTDFDAELFPKRLELLKAAAPKTTRVAFFQESVSDVFDAASSEALNKELDAAARTLGISLLRVSLSTPQDFEQATAAIVRERADALMYYGPRAFAMRKELAELAARQRLPSIAGTSLNGAMMSYGPSITDSYRKAATFVARILNGAKPADLPVERPTRFELVINLKIAKAIGLAIPSLLVLRADEVIE